MLLYAFEVMKVRRVEFSVDPLNEKSNCAMKRLGAQFEGRMRKWRYNSSSDHGDRNIYSILDDEYKSILEKLNKF